VKLLIYTFDIDNDPKMKSSKSKNQTNFEELRGWIVLSVRTLQLSEFLGHFRYVCDWRP